MQARSRLARIQSFLAFTLRQALRRTEVALVPDVLHPITCPSYCSQCPICGEHGWSPARPARPAIVTSSRMSLNQSVEYSQHSEDGYTQPGSGGRRCLAVSCPATLDRHARMSTSWVKKVKY
eukprot:5285358-Amphidinium_carterae.1